MSGPFCFRNADYFEVPEEPPLAPMPLLPAPVLLAPPALPLVLGEALEPLEEEPMLPEDEPVLPEEPTLPDVEPLVEPCSRKQRSFSRPVRVSHCVLLPPIDGEVLELPVALGEELDDPVDPLAEESVLVDPPTLCDDDCAIAAAENAKSAAIVAVERVFNIVASPM